MKKSISAPNLTKLGNNCHPKSQIKKSISTQALPEWFASASDSLIHEIQAEAVLKVPIAQVVACVDNKIFPADILNGNVNDNKINVANCLITPTEHPETTIVRRQMQATTSMCAVDSERYVTLLKRIRRGKKKRGEVNNL